MTIDRDSVGQFSDVTDERLGVFRRDLEADIGDMARRLSEHQQAVVTLGRELCFRREVLVSMNEEAERRAAARTPPIPPLPMIPSPP